MDYQYGFDHSKEKKRSTKFAISRRTQAALFDLSFPFIIILLGYIVYAVCFFLYVGAGAVTVGMLWFLLEDEFAALPGLLYKLVPILIIVVFIVQTVLSLVYGISIGKSIFNLKIVDSVTESKPTFKQLFIRGLMNNWLTKLILPYSIYSYVIYRRSGKALHDSVSGTKVVERHVSFYK